MNTFKDYLEDKYLDLVCERLDKYLRKAYYEGSNKTVHYYENDEAKLIRADFHAVFIDDLISDATIFTIIVIAEQTKDLDYNRYDEPGAIEKWYEAKCSCLISNTISNFEVLAIDEYSGKGRRQYSTTERLVPYIKKEAMDSLANEILEKYYPEALKGSPIDANELAKRLGLTVIVKKLKNTQVMGKIFFKTVQINKERNGIKRKETIHEKTIIINAKSGLFNYDRSYNFTVVHECIHWLLHRKVFLLERLNKKKAVLMECYSDGRGASEANENDLMEWQANTLAARIIMPLTPFCEKVNNLLSKYKATNQTEDCLDYYERLVFELSNHFNVSVEATKIRLLECGYDFVLGIFNEIDGKKVKPHSFAKGTLANNETFCISPEGAMYIFLAEKYVNRSDALDNYIYIESHICYNSLKYIRKNGDNKYTLTDYARRNMHECCCKVELYIENETRNDEHNYYNFIILNRKANSKSQKVVEELKETQKRFLKNDIYVDFTADELIKELFSSMTNDPVECLKLLKKYSGYTFEEIVEQSELSKSTIDRYFSNAKGYDKICLIKLLIAMESPYVVSKHILQICGFTLQTANNEDHLLNTALQHFYYYGAKNVFSFLRKNKVKI